ncbi:MAG: A/G-specific adenine glycosylase [Bacteroidetes bacterium]|nr:A/G-specific adenine glycosylase [Bacteroidota bacterium]
MLQQTQVARVLKHFPLWIKRFPTTAALARASRRAVLLAWSGLGYNRRALSLHAAAKEIMERHNGRIPSDIEALKALPGFGPYTAHAVTCFGYRHRVPIVDVNIRRVLSRLSRNMRETDAMLPEAEVWTLAASLLPPRAFYNWNQGLMDLGATICTARQPDCEHCPLSTECPSAGRLQSAPARSASVIRETPRRIYRGRVIEHLRHRPRHCDRADRLCILLFSSSDAVEQSRVLDILATLQNDGMIRATAGRRPVEDIGTFTDSLDMLHICLTD